MNNYISKPSNQFLKVCCGEDITTMERLCDLGKQKIGVELVCTAIMNDTRTKSRTFCCTISSAHAIVWQFLFMLTVLPINKWTLHIQL